MSIVADHYRFVVGVDTHAATHTYALVESPSGRELGTETGQYGRAAGNDSHVERIAMRPRYGSEGWGDRPLSDVQNAGQHISPSWMKPDTDPTA